MGVVKGKDLKEIMTHMGINYDKVCHCITYIGYFIFK
jgi:hypothetical protein